MTLHLFSPLLGSLALLACLDGAAVAASPDTAAVTDSVLRETLIALERRSWVAWQNHDGKFFTNFLSDDHVEIHNYGITDKASVVAGVSSPACKVETYNISEPRFTRVAADSALLTYRAEQKTTCGAFPVPSPVWATSLYVIRGGRWLNVLYQQTPVAGP